MGFIAINDEIYGSASANDIAFSFLGDESLASNVAEALEYIKENMGGSVDTEFDETSLNAIANSIVTTRFEQIESDLLKYYTKTETYSQSEVDDLIKDFVSSSITINGKSLSSDITLNASDIGALPDDTVIPSKTSDLVNDSGFLTSFTETDPTVPSWAKQPNKPSYTASEVGALPDTTVIPTVPTKLSAFTDDLGSSPTHTHSQYLTSYTETDPTVPSHVKNITSTNISNWGTAYTHSQSTHAPTDAQKNVQSDWNATSGDSYIKNKPKIPSEVTESTVSGWGFTKNTGTYSKPSSGIPKTDLASAVQTSLGLADTAIQNSSIAVTNVTYTDGVLSATALSGKFSGVISKSGSNDVALVNAINDFKSNIPTNNNQLTNGAGYITSSGSCAYATSAGSATDSTKLPLAGGTMTGNISLGSGNLRIGQSSNSMYLGNSGNAGWVYVQDMASQASTCGWKLHQGGSMEILNNLTVGTMTAQSTYKVGVSGSLNATTLYENGTSLANKYLGKSGGTITGDLVLDYGVFDAEYRNDGFVAKDGKSYVTGVIGGFAYYNDCANTDTFYEAKRIDTDRTVDFGVGSGGTNAGIYDKDMNAWMIHGDKSKVYVKGCTTPMVNMLNWGTSKELIMNLTSCGIIIVNWNEIFGVAVQGSGYGDLHVTKIAGSGTVTCTGSTVSGYRRKFTFSTSCTAVFIWCENGRNQVTV